MILMAILSFQGDDRPADVPVPRADQPRLVEDAVRLERLQHDRGRRQRVGSPVALAQPRRGRCSWPVFGFSLSMAFRRRWRLKSDVIAFYILMLALMTPAFLVGLGNQLLWKFMGETPSLWYTALGANVIWGIPFSFLVMLAVWNRYDRHVEEAARDLGANAADDVPGGDAAARLDRDLRQLPVRLHADLERLRPDDPAAERLRGAAAADPDRHLAVRAGRSFPTSTRSGPGRPRSR